MFLALKEIKYEKLRYGLITLMIFFDFIFNFYAFIASSWFSFAKYAGS